MPIEEPDRCGARHPNSDAECSLVLGHLGPHWGHPPQRSWPQETQEVACLRAERDGLNRTVAELRREAIAKTHRIRHLEKELLKYVAPQPEEMKS